MSGDAGLGPSIKDFREAADRPQTPPDLILYTVKQVAALLEWNEETVKVYLSNGELKGFKLAGRWRVSQAALREFLEAHHAGSRP